MAASLTLDNPAVAGLLFYGAICIMKYFAVVFLVGRARQKNKVYIADEDIVFHTITDPSKKKPIYNDPDVERARRSHQNDLENIPIFLILGVFYVLTDPTPWVALLHFRVFTACRIVFTIAYQFSLQPFRSLAWTAGLVTCLSMAVQILLSVW